MKDSINSEYRRFRDALSDNTEALAEQLDRMAEDPSLLEDAFFRHMAFGIGGLPVSNVLCFTLEGAAL